jgi:hypothetical protein
LFVFKRGHLVVEGGSILRSAASEDSWLRGVIKTAMLSVGEPSGAPDCLLNTLRHPC